MIRTIHFVGLILFNLYMVDSCARTSEVTTTTVAATTSTTTVLTTTTTQSVRI
jgi:hypothetical protein